MTVIGHNSQRDWAPAVEALADALRALGEGETLTYDRAGQIVNEPVASNYHALRMALKRLEREKVHFECYPGVGYVRLTPAAVATRGTTRSVQRTYRAASRGMKRAVIDSADYGRLSMAERSEMHAKVAVLATVKTAAHGNHVRAEVRRQNQTSLEDVARRMLAAE